VDRVRLFLLVLNNRARGTGHKMEHRKFHMNMRTNSFTCEGDRALEPAAQAVESPSLEILQIHLDAFLCSLS